MNFKRLIGLMLVLSVIAVLASCGRSTPTTGFISEINKAENKLTIDISEWARGPGEEGVGYETTVYLDGEVNLQQENGEKAEFGSLKAGQDVSLTPKVEIGEDWTSGTITVLSMNNQEKMGHFLGSKSEGFYTVVFYEGQHTSDDEYQAEDFEKEAPAAFEDGIGWKPYNPDYIIDFKQKYEIAQFPVVLVFKDGELVLKTYELKKVQELLNEQ